jgi:hypothetical protein
VLAIGPKFRRFKPGRVRWIFHHHLRFVHSTVVFLHPKLSFAICLSLVSSSVSAWFFTLRLTPSIQLSLGLSLLTMDF